MTVALLLDMNIPPSWVTLLHAHGIKAEHWSRVGMPAASDEEVMAHARAHGHALVTYDLDFTRLLALAYAAGPSVVLLRGLHALPERQTVFKIAQALSESAAMLATGALIVIDPAKSRIRALPLHHATH